MTDATEDNDDIPSKSARKREMDALKKLGQHLMDLPDSQLGQLPLSEDLLDAFALYRRLHQREARRRQLQLIGKLMRSEQVQVIEEKLAAFAAHDKVFHQHFQRIEQLRDELIADSEAALTVLFDDYPHLDRQHLRQLIRQAQREQSQQKPPAASRKLFRYLRDNIDPLA